ncbi:hypothetical protein H4Q26_007744 [Puccinia striiformis f. sp. tritici PST-130]|nr:hypothetical protein H4Q26_007744 [Puccinia striiformis f. sp. tritici PST-130]
MTALRERITEGTTGRSANTELVPSKTRTVSELTGRSSAATFLNILEGDLGAVRLEHLKSSTLSRRK